MKGLSQAFEPLLEGEKGEKECDQEERQKSDQISGTDEVGEIHESAKQVESDDWKDEGTDQNERVPSIL